MAQETIYRQFGLLGGIFRFADEHKTLTGIILAIETVALAYAVITYNFTTNF